MTKRSFERLAPGSTYLTATGDTLPMAGSKDKSFAEIGVVFGDVCAEDPMFRSCTLPEGWTVIAVNDLGLHALMDAASNKRARIVCRNRAGMREVHIKALRRFGLTMQSGDGKHVGIVTDRGQTVYRTPPYTDEMNAMAVSQGFLDEHWPKWLGYSAYWDAL